MFCEHWHKKNVSERFFFVFVIIEDRTSDESDKNLPRMCDLPPVNHSYVVQRFGHIVGEKYPDASSQIFVIISNALMTADAVRDPDFLVKQLECFVCLVVVSVFCVLEIRDYVIEIYDSKNLIL